MAYGKKLSAIASFDTEGRMIPLYIRAEGVSLKVEHYVVRSDRNNTIEYDVTVDDGGTRKQIRIAYSTYERLWRLVVPPYFDA